MKTKCAALIFLFLLACGGKVEDDVIELSIIPGATDSGTFFDYSVEKAMILLNEVNGPTVAQFDVTDILKGTERKTIPLKTTDIPNFDKDKKYELVADLEGNYAARKNIYINDLIPEVKYPFQSRKNADCAYYLPLMFGKGAPHKLSFRVVEQSFRLTSKKEPPLEVCLTELRYST
jgi:hypothetical protein